MSEMIGITTEEEFERLPIAVRRKVCFGPFSFQCNLRPCVLENAYHRDPYSFFRPVFEVGVKHFRRWDDYIETESELSH